MTDDGEWWADEAAELRRRNGPADRYWLTRHEPGLGHSGALVVVMLNPSTATDELDDPTVRRLRAFARRWECEWLHVANLYSQRATKPAELDHHLDVTEWERDAWRLALGFTHEADARVVCAWGNHARQRRIAAFETAAIQTSDPHRVPLHDLRAFGHTKQGQPKHPLYLRGDTNLVPYVS